MLGRTTHVLNPRLNNSSHCRLRRLLRSSVEQYNTWLPLSPLPILQHQLRLHPPPLLLHPPPFHFPPLVSLCVRLLLNWTVFVDTAAFQMRSFLPSPAL